MSYKIIYNESDNMFYMDGKPERFVGNHLENIGKEHKIKNLDNCLFESDMLAMLLQSGIQVDLLEEDGSKMSW